MNKELTDEQKIANAQDMVKETLLSNGRADGRQLFDALLAGSQAIKEREDLKAENDRLREALRTICYGHDSRDTITEICEKALEGK